MMHMTTGMVKQNTEEMSSEGDFMSEYRIDDLKFMARTCHLIFRKTLIWDDEIVYDVFALVGGSNGKEIEVGTIDDLNQVDRFVNEFQSQAGTKVIGTSILDGYDDLKEDWT